MGQKIRKLGIMVTIMAMLTSCSTAKVTSNKDTTVSEPAVTLTENSTEAEDLDLEAAETTITNYYIQLYRYINMHQVESERYFEGETVNCVLYRSEDKYVVAKIVSDREEDFYSNTIFEIKKDGTIEQVEVPDQDERVQIIDNDEMIELSRVSFDIPNNENIVFNDYDGKEELLDEFKELIYYRYFDYSEDIEGGEEPIFYESTKATKVDLIDFDEKNTSYELLVYTEDNKVWQVSLEYVEEDECYEFFEQVGLDFSMDDIENYNQDTNTDSLLEQMVCIYYSSEGHIIESISDEYEIADITTQISDYMAEMIYDESVKDYRCEELGRMRC